MLAALLLELAYASPFGRQATAPELEHQVWLAVYHSHMGAKSPAIMHSRLYPRADRPSLLLDHEAPPILVRWCWVGL